MSRQSSSYWSARYAITAWYSADTSWKNSVVAATSPSRPNSSSLRSNSGRWCARMVPDADWRLCALLASRRSFRRSWHLWCAPWSLAPRMHRQPALYPRSPRPLLPSVGRWSARAQSPRALGSQTDQPARIPQILDPGFPSECRYRCL